MLPAPAGGSGASLTPRTHGGRRKATQARWFRCDGVS